MNREELMRQARQRLELIQQDLDKLFDMDGDDDVAEDDGADDMAAAMMADAAEDESDAGDDDVLELTEELAVESTDDLDMVDGLAEDLDNVAGDVSFAPDPEPAEDIMASPEPEAEPEALFEPEEPVIQSKPIPDDLPDVAPEDYLTSAATGQAVHAALDNFSDMLISTKAQTIEEMVRDMLRGPSGCGGRQPAHHRPPGAPGLPQALCLRARRRGCGPGRVRGRPGVVRRAGLGDRLPRRRAG